jgi:hypothetical protein
MKTLQREKPILFADEMVRAIFDGRKTQTRRPVKERDFQESVTPGYDFTFRDRNSRWQDVNLLAALHPPRANYPLQCPFGATGDVLWVREAFSHCVLHAPVPGQDPISVSVPTGKGDHVVYRADQPHWTEWAGKWRPSIHMPRWASRLMLQITSVGIHRLQAISYPSIRAEGYEPFGMEHMDPDASCRAKLRHSWNQKYRNGPYAWDRNPWVWAITFKRVE